MRVLLIAPPVDGIPDIGAAMAAIASAHECEVLSAPDLTAREIATTAGRAGYDVIWFVGHLDGTGEFALPNASSLTCEAVVSLVQVSGASLAVLMFCRSWQMANQIVARTPADAVVATGDLLASEAIWAAVLFARALTTRPARLAFELTLQGQHFAYLENYRRRITDAIMEPDPSRQLERMYSTITSIDGKLDRLQLSISDLDKRVSILEARTPGGFSREIWLVLLVLTSLTMLTLFLVLTR